MHLIILTVGSVEILKHNCIECVVVVVVLFILWIGRY